MRGPDACPAIETAIARLLMLLALAWLAMPAAARAETYKCKQRDGSVAFQDQPCANGSVGSVVALPAIPNGSSGPEALKNAAAAAAGAKAAADARERDAQRRRASADAEARNQEAADFNRHQGCNAARRELGVLKEQHPVFRYDGKGDRQYVADKDRQAEIARAEAQVAQACN
jgi:hypothetical protein